MARSGPEVQTLSLLLDARFGPATPNKPIWLARSGAAATSATLALSGDAGYWVVPAGVPDVSAPELPTFRAFAAFSASLAVGDYTLEVRAVDAGGRFGAPKRQTLTALPIAPSRAVSGALTVTLTWDTDADLDLHVVDPANHEIYHGAPSSQDPFSATAMPSAASDVLDIDSNADCVIDGLHAKKT